MSRKISASVEELANFADYVSEFAQKIDNDCTSLILAFQKLDGAVDRETSDAFRSSIENIENILQEKQVTLNKLEAQVRQYADFVLRLKQTVQNQNGTVIKNTPKEKLAAFVMSCEMRDHLNAVDSEYQTVEGYKLAKAKSVVNGVATVIEKVTGVTITPQLMPIDEANVDDQIDTAIKLIDGQIALKQPEKRINRSGTKVTKEQINSHTLVVDDINELWKTK